MKANSVTVILMTIIVSVTVFSNERQRMDIAAPDHSDLESRVHCIGDTGTNFDRRHMRRGEVWPVSAEPAAEQTMNMQHSSVHFITKEVDVTS